MQHKKMILKDTEWKFKGFYLLKSPSSCHAVSKGIITQRNGRILWIESYRSWARKTLSQQSNHHIGTVQWLSTGPEHTWCGWNCRFSRRTRVTRIQRLELPLTVIEHTELMRFYSWTELTDRSWHVQGESLDTSGTGRRNICMIQTVRRRAQARCSHSLSRHGCLTEDLTGAAGWGRRDVEADKDN